MEKRSARLGLVRLLVLVVTIADTGCFSMQQSVDPYTGQPRTGLVMQQPPFLPGGLQRGGGGLQLPRITINGREFMFPMPGGVGYPQPGQVPGWNQGWQQPGWNQGWQQPGWNQGQIPYAPAGSFAGATAGTTVDPRTGQTFVTQPGVTATLPNQPQFQPVGAPLAPGSTPTGPTAPVGPSQGVATSLLGVQSSMDGIISQQNQAWTSLQQNEQQTRASRQQQQAGAQNAKQAEINQLTARLGTTTDSTQRQAIERDIATRNQELSTLRTTQQREVEQDTQTLTANRTQLKQQQVTQVNGEITNLQTQAKARQDEATRLRTLIQENQRKDADLRARITAKDAEMQQITATYNAAEQTRTQAVTAETTGIQTELRTLQTSLSTATDATRAGIQTQIDAKNRALADANTRSQQAYQSGYQKYQTDQQRITLEGQTLRTELQTLINQNSGLPQQLADADTLAQRLQQQVAAYQQRLSAIQAN